MLDHDDLHSDTPRRPLRALFSALLWPFAAILRLPLKYRKTTGLVICSAAVVCTAVLVLGGKKAPNSGFPTPEIWQELTPKSPPTKPQRDGFLDRLRHLLGVG
jgi:hypothetical protein